MVETRSNRTEGNNSTIEDETPPSIQLTEDMFRRLISLTNYQNNEINKEVQDLRKGLREAIPIISIKSAPVIIYEYLKKCEEYFSSFDTQLDWIWKRRVATSKLNADALIWWENYSTTNSVQDWKTYADAIRYHFIPLGHERNILRELATIRQGGTPLREFLLHFSKLVGQTS
ncbi:hypothetical protein HMI54_014533 [Coelomomyces lativittatus]|nr:hypothetical protein HMI54_014533 [Coelomomyces lativittatus]